MLPTRAAPPHIFYIVASTQYCVTNSPGRNSASQNVRRIRAAGEASSLGPSLKRDPLNIPSGKGTRSLLLPEAARCFFATRSNKGWLMACKAQPFLPLKVTIVLLVLPSKAWRMARPWTNQSWCLSTVEPEWPLAYSKFESQAWERKGRTNIDRQDERHECTTFGVESKCHRCEQIACGINDESTCDYQFQGVRPTELSRNVPTASDAPWAVNGSHRYDFGGQTTSHVCVMLSGGNCTSPLATDTRRCATRCWGWREGSASPRAHLEAIRQYEGRVGNGDRYRTVDGESEVATESWEYAKRSTAQGEVTTLAGVPKRHGFRDSSLSIALFNRPSGVAVDAERNIYVADTLNHAVRVVNRTANEVYTLAGARPPQPEAGHRDGPAAVARFSSPRGIAISYEDGDWGNPAKLVVYVADTGNHRIRKITNAAFGRTNAIVECFAGRCGNGTVSKYATNFAADPEPGFADGQGVWARFDAPHGVAVHASGDVIVADTNNHLVRVINASKFVFTLAGEVKLAEPGPDGAPLPGCAPPCLRGVMGIRDGNLSKARFQYPKSVAIDEATTQDYNRTTGRYTILVTDAFRLRRVVPADGWWHTTYEFDGGVMTKGGRVVTLAGRDEAGQRDGAGNDARFAQPEGVVAAADGHVYVADRASCRLRRVSPPRLSVADIRKIRALSNDACSTRLVDIWRPDGCAMYDPPVGSRDLKITARFGHIHYNHASRFVRAKEPGTGRFAETDSPEAFGRAMKNCIGSPPPDRRDKRGWQTGENLVVDDLVFDNDEDTGQGTTLHLRCPSGCLQQMLPKNIHIAGAPPGYFSDESPICPVAVLAGALEDSTGGLITLEIHHGAIARTLTNESFNLGYAALRHAIAAKTTMAPTPMHTSLAPTISSSASSSANKPTTPQTFSPSTQSTPTEMLNYNSSKIAPLAEVYGKWPRGALLVERLFSVRAFLESDPFEVQTIAGKATAPLDSPCGFKDAHPPQAAEFDEPTGVALYARAEGARENETLVVADASNHVIRGVTAVCSFPCENGGRCIGPETCLCSSGWQGVDCTTPVCTSGVATLIGFGDMLCRDTSRTVCVAPETCACAPGWRGQDCLTPMCVQRECQHGGTCIAPDTCKCAYGWFDPNCTTPVCTQTCGNGGNCTAPDTCACPTHWTGIDCREPVCDQICKNGGQCIAPHTCQCPPQWHGNDCGLPVCHQGYFVPFGDESAAIASWGSRLRRVPTYTPCFYSSWCNWTNGFHCNQERRNRLPIEIPSGSAWRRVTGRLIRPTRCDRIEIREDAITQFVSVSEQNKTTRFARYTPPSPYGWNATGYPWRAYIGPRDGGRARTKPWNHAADRQVAFIEWVNATQGVYICANGGNCTAPDVCRCAPGWIGFDCRTPVCEQGYYYAEQESFVSGTEDPNEVTYFESFMDPNMSQYRLHWPYSNPDFVLVEESFNQYDTVTRTTVTHEGIRYTLESGGQGGYRCSIRSRSEWEGPGVVFDHVNFFSQHMDAKTQADGNQYTFWKNMSWPPTHYKTRKLELPHHLPNGKTIIYVYTNEGHLRDGLWRTTGAGWQAGTCIVEFQRVCESSTKLPDSAIDDLNLRIDGREKSGAFVEAGTFVGDISSARLTGVYVQDTDFAYRPRISYDTFRAFGHGRWTTKSGECVDQVLRGCYNNGTCVAPNTCQCATGWTGSDCTTPICSQICEHHGNCTAPNVCTCEAGWDGHDCSMPICAQECHHGGKCVAPDTCMCQQWESNWPTGHEPQRPIFRKPNGAPQLTGWTGFDCAVPICTQAKKFTPNVGPADEIRAEIQMSVSIFQSNQAIRYPRLAYTELGGRGYDGREDTVSENGQRLLKCDTKPRCPSYDEMVSVNVGETFAKGCGFDVLHTGCCVRILEDIDDDDITAAIEANPQAYKEYGTYVCHSCDLADQIISASNFTCISANMLDGAENAITSNEWTYEQLQLEGDRYKHGQLRTKDYVKICGPTRNQKNFKEELYPRPDYNDGKNNEPRTNITSFLFLCGITEWLQGDYIDNAGLCTDEGDCSAASGVGIEYGFDHPVERFERGRHVRINTPNITRIERGYGDEDLWQYGHVVRGEGIYECYNGGSCIGPDVCTCTDGWSGFDCQTPLCRHFQAQTGSIAGCENGGVCKYKDICTCIQAPSVLKQKYEGAPAGITGWTGTDCIPMLQCHRSPNCPPYL